MIYLDNSATTFPKPECVYETCDRFARTLAVNPGRGAYRAARDATSMVRDVKKELISLLDAKEQANVAFAPSATIAMNQILWGLDLSEGSNVYVSPYEHNAVLRPLDLLRRNKGVRIFELPLAGDLSLDIPGAKEMFSRRKPDLCCITAVSNVTGYALPASEIFRLAKEYGAVTVLDGAQAVGLLPMRFSELKADFITFAGHKTLYAPFGIAGMYIREGADLAPVITGGNGIRAEDPSMPAYLPEKLEAGSMDSVAIAGLAASLKWLKTEDVMAREEELRSYLLSKLREVPGTIIYEPPGGSPSVAITSFNVEGFRANEVAAILDREEDVAVRAGHHCAGLIHKHLGNERFDGTVRVSPGFFNTKEDIDALVTGLGNIDREKLKGIDADILRGNC